VPTRNQLVSVALILTATVSGLAQSQVATVSSNGSFRMRGVSVSPSPAIPGWPVMKGDILQAGDSPLQIVLSDDSIVVLAPGTTATVDLAGGTPVVALENGSAHYALKQLTSARLQCKDDAIAVREVVGDASCGRRSALLAPQWWAAGAGAAVAGVAISKRSGPPVSPTQCNNGGGGGNGKPVCP